MLVVLARVRKVLDDQLIQIIYYRLQFWVLTFDLYFEVLLYSFHLSNPYQRLLLKVTKVLKLYGTFYDVDLISAQL